MAVPPFVKDDAPDPTAPSAPMPFRGRKRGRKGGKKLSPAQKQLKGMTPGKPRSFAGGGR